MISFRHIKKLSISSRTRDITNLFFLVAGGSEMESENFWLQVKFLIY